MSLVPLDPRNKYRPVPKKDREKWINEEGGDAGRDLPKKGEKTEEKEKKES